MDQFALDKLLKPRSIAIVGASPRELSVGHMVQKNLESRAYGGALYPVNPRYEEVRGVRCYPSLAALPEAPDAVFIGIPAASGPALLEEAGALGIGAAYINASGFADAGTGGAVLQDGIRAIAAHHGMALCGPNNVGAINVAHHAPVWTTDLPRLDPGPVALISHSGSVAIGLAQDDRHLGLAYVITPGNEAVCDMADYLDYVVRDDAVSTVMLFVESIRRPDAFAAAAAEAHRRGKPILAVKAGRTEAGRAAVAGHTGALSGEDEVYAAFFRRHGVVRLNDLDELNEAAVLFSCFPTPPRSPGVLAVTLSGGQCSLIADLAEDTGLSLPPLSKPTRARVEPVFPDYSTVSNPLDAWGAAWDAEVFRIALDGVLADPTYGAVIGVTDPPNLEGYDLQVAIEMAEVLAEAASGTDARLMLLNATAAPVPNERVRTILDGAGLAYLSGMRSALGALAAWSRAADPEQDDIAIDETATAGWRARAASAGEMTEPAWFDLLRDAGVPLANSRPVANADEAVGAAEALGYPVVLKGTSPALPHKSELGLVRLGLTDADALAAAFTELDAILAAQPDAGPAACITVQPLARGGIELIAGIRNDPAFGSLIVVGVGGTLVEVLKQSSLRIGPVSADTARTMLDETVAGTLLRGTRGKGPYDVDAAARAISALSRFGAATYGVLAAVEINPLIVLEQGQGVLGVDALLEPATNDRS
jgi:acyl-CoA synthetase (NDP forming)